MKNLPFLCAMLIAFGITEMAFGQCHTSRATFSAGVSYGTAPTFSNGTTGGCCPCPQDTVGPVFSAGTQPVYFQAANPVFLQARPTTFFAASGHNFSGGVYASGGGGGRNFQLGLINRN